MRLDLGTASFGNRSLLTEIKENTPLLKHFWPMYIDFDDYPRYCSRNKIFEINVNESIQCDHGYAYSSGKKQFTHGLI